MSLRGDSQNRKSTTTANSKKQKIKKTPLANEECKHAPTSLFWFSLRRMPTRASIKTTTASTEKRLFFFSGYGE